MCAKIKKRPLFNIQRACVRVCVRACVRACMRACVRACVVCLPLDIIDQSCLEQQVSSGKQVVTDEVLIGSHSHTIADTQGTENI